VGVGRREGFWLELGRDWSLKSSRGFSSLFYATLGLNSFGLDPLSIQK